MRLLSNFPIPDTAFLMHSHIACRSALVFAAFFNCLAPSQQAVGGLFTLPSMKPKQEARSLVTSAHEVALLVLSAALLLLFHAFTAANPENSKTMAKTPT